MSTTETATDRDAITAVVQLYIDGSATGDVSKLQEAFHPDARMYGSLGDQRLDIPIAELYPIVSVSTAMTPKRRFLRMARSSFSCMPANGW